MFFSVFYLLNRTPRVLHRSSDSGGILLPDRGRKAMGSVYIPVQNSEEEVRVILDQLPKDASDILDILKAEQAPLDLWLIIAVFELSSRLILLFNLLSD